MAASAIGYDVAPSWSASNDNVGVAGYRIERAVAGGETWSQIAVTSQVAYTDAGRPSGQWEYRVTAADAASNASPVSDPVTATVADLVAPTAPTGVATDVFFSSVTLTWNSATDDTGVTGYGIERSVSGSGQWTEVGTTEANLYRDTGVSPGSWSYRVVATDAAGNASPPVGAQAVVFDRSRPSAPAELTTTPSGFTVALDWTPAADNVGVTGYRVERSATGDGGWVQLARPTSESYVDTERPPGTWYYRVTATDAAGNVGPASPVASATVASEAGEPELVLLRPSADAYVNQSKPTKNFGTLNQMFSLGPNPQLLSYLEFELPGAPAGTTLTSAVLRLRSTTSDGSGSQDLQEVALVEGTWAEETVTYEDRPTVTDTVLGQLATGVADDAYFDVVLDPNQLRGSLDTAAAVALYSPAGTGDNMFFWSRDHSVENYLPQLTLTFSPGQ